MDKLTVYGIVFALLAISGGQYLEGGRLDVLLNGPALLIVLGGSFGAVLLQTTSADLERAGRIFFWMFSPPKYNYQATIEKFIRFSLIVQRKGLVELEKEFKQEKDPFIRKSIETILTGVSAGILRNVLELEMDRQEQRDLHASNVFKSMGAYCPTIGIVGAVIGLIQVMRNLNDPSQLGVGIAVAFVATIYGVGLANLVFIPISFKLKNVVGDRTRYHEMVIEAATGIAQAEQPSSLKRRLMSYCHA